MRYAHPGTEGAKVNFKSRYGNFINGQFVEPVGGQYFTNLSPVNGQPIAEFPRSDAADIEKALDAAHAAADAWGRTSVQERSLVLLKISDRIEQNLEVLAVTVNAVSFVPAYHLAHAAFQTFFQGCLPKFQQGGFNHRGEHDPVDRLGHPLISPGLGRRPGP